MEKDNHKLIEKLCLEYSQGRVFRLLDYINEKILICDGRRFPGSPNYHDIFEGIKDELKEKDIFMYELLKQQIDNNHKYALENIEKLRLI